LLRVRQPSVHGAATQSTADIVKTMEDVPPQQMFTIMKEIQVRMAATAVLHSSRRMRAVLWRTTAVVDLRRNIERWLLAHGIGCWLMGLDA